MSCNRTFLKRVIRYASFSGRILRRTLAKASLAGRMKYQVGVRWSIVTCAAPLPSPFSVIEGTMVTAVAPDPITTRSEEHTSELQSLMRISYAVFCLKKKKIHNQHKTAHI